jgi:MoaA/NifB/PqqE/SkfB family radical SAM enzyme
MSKRIKKIRLITNGSRLIKPEIAEAIIQAAEQTNLQIRVSLNSGSEETHNRLHGVKGHFKDIIRGLELIGREGKVQSRISYILCEDNYSELADAYSIAQNCNASVFSIRAMTGPHGIRILPLSDKARLAALVAIKNMQGKSKYPGNPKLDVCKEYIHYLTEGCQPNTFKDYPVCYYCGSSRIIITPPDPGTAWTCTYWRGDPRFKIAELVEAPLGSQKFELRRQEAIRRITPCLDCADVICNRHQANLAIYNQLNAIHKKEGLMTVI